MSLLGFVFFFYGIWGQGVQKLAADRRQQKENVLRNEKKLVSAS
jgi:hypothetical protein